MSWGLDNGAMSGEWWQLWTCHVAHWNARHLLLNAIAAVPPLALAPPHLRRRMAGWALLTAPLLSAFLLFTGMQGEYRGASGLVVALWSFIGFALLREGAGRTGIAMLVAIAGKLTAEAFHLLPPAPGFVTLDAIHYAGAFAGAASGIAWTPTNRFRFV
jgi:hypothetical protein